MSKPTVHHIPVCPFCQRLEILLELKGCRDRVDFEVVDVTRPRPQALLQKARGTTALPILETADGRILKESLVILEYLDELFPEPRIAERHPGRRGREPDAARGRLLHAGYARLDAFLVEHAQGGRFLFETFGWAEAVFTPLFARFWFLEYYEDFRLPDGGRYARVRRWIEACLAHPAAQQVTKEQIVKLYYDYAQGAGNGALLPGRRRSSFTFEPDWRARPWPPRGKYGLAASDAELGL